MAQPMGTMQGLMDGQALADPGGLYAADSIHIRQKFEFIEMCGIESKNKYDVRIGGPVPAPTRDFVLAARTLKPHSLPGQPRVTLSLRKEHFKSSLRAVPGGKEPNMRPKTRSS